MYKACIFDLDGTLCDSLESIAHCSNRVLQKFGMKEAPLENYKIFVGDGADMLIRRFLRFGGDQEAARFEEAKRLYREYFREGCLYNVKPYPGIMETLQGLKEQGAVLGVISNKPHPNTASVIAHVFGSDFFQWIEGQSEKFPRKPDPSGALYVAKKLQVKPEECIYIGDTGTDMRTGRAAGMYTVGVLWGFRDEKELKETGAQRLIDHPSKLLELYQGG